MKCYNLMIVRGLLVSILVFFVGCGEQSQLKELRQYIYRVKNTSSLPVSSIPEPKPYKAFSYQAKTLRDPFAPPVADERVREEKSGRPYPGRPHDPEPLEQFPLNTLSVVGVVTDGVPWAVIRAPDKTVHRVTKGNFVGENYGEIVDVGKNVVTLQEMFVNPHTGEWETRSAVLKLKMAAERSPICADVAEGEELCVD